MRVRPECLQVIDGFGVLEFVKGAVRVAAVARRFVGERGQGFDQLAHQVVAQRIADLVDVLFKRFGRLAAVVVELMRGRLGREDAAVEVGAERPVMRAELDRVADRRAIGHRLQIAGRSAHRHDLVAIGPAALGVDVFPVELLDGVVRRRSAGLRGVLIGKRRHRGQAGLRARPNVDPVDGKSQAPRHFAAKGPGDDGDIVVRERNRFHGRLRVRREAKIASRKTRSTRGKPGM